MTELRIGRADPAYAARLCRCSTTSNRRRTEAHAFYEGRGYDRTGFRFARLL